MLSRKEFLHNFKKPQKQLLQQPSMQTNEPQKSGN